MFIDFETLKSFPFGVGLSSIFTNIRSFLALRELGLFLVNLALGPLRMIMKRSRKGSFCA